MIDIQNEFRILGIDIKDPIPQAILRMAEIHKQGGHSGFSHGFTINKFRVKAQKLLDTTSRLLQEIYLNEDLQDWIDSFEDEMDKRICREVVKLLEVVAALETDKQAQAVEWFIQLMRNIPIAPLTGEDDEWSEYETGEFQNKRCSAVFKEGTKAYYLDAVVFNDKNGMGTFTGSVLIDGARYFSYQYVSFPYNPVNHYVEVEQVHPEDPESNEFRFVNPEEAKAVFELFSQP